MVERAMVLAAGKGTRLYPLTGELPKPLVPVGGVPIVEHIFGLLGRHGIHEAHVNACYLGEKLAERYAGGAAGAPERSVVGVRLLLEPDLSGTAGGVKRLADAARAAGDPFEETFVVIMGDALTDVDLSSLVAHHKERGALATMALVGVGDVSGYGVVEVNGDGDVAGFQEKPSPPEARSNLANTGIYVFDPAVLDLIPSGRAYDFARDVFPRILEGGETFAAFDASGSYWSDVGTLRAYKDAQSDALHGRVRGLTFPGEAWGDGRLRVGARARLHPAAYARIFGPCVVGNGARIGCASEISGGVSIGAGCRVGDGALVSRSVLLPGSTVGEGARVEGCVLGPGYEVAPGAALRDDVLFRAARGGEAASAPPYREAAPLPIAV